MSSEKSEVPEVWCVFLACLDEVSAAGIQTSGKVFYSGKKIVRLNHFFYPKVNIQLEQNTVFPAS